MSVISAMACADSSASRTAEDGRASAHILWDAPERTLAVIFTVAVRLCCTQV